MISYLQNKVFDFYGSSSQQGCLLSCRFLVDFSVFRPLSSGHGLQSSESVHVVCKIPKTDFNFSPDSSYTSYYKAYGHPLSKNVLYPRSYFGSRMVASPLPFGERLVAATLPLYMFAISFFFKYLQFLIGSVRRVSIDITAAIFPVEKLLEDIAVMHR